jgi:hypothetical protein
VVVVVVALVVVVVVDCSVVWGADVPGSAVPLQATTASAIAARSLTGVR